jgi:hypothetical protein
MDVFGKSYAKYYNLEMKNSYKWMTFNELSLDSWYAVIIFKKKYE